MLATLSKLARLIGPKALLAVKTLTPIILAHPEFQARLQRLLEGVPERAAKLPVSRKRRVASSLKRARNVAGEILDGARDPQTKDQATEWLERTDDLGRSLALVSVGARSSRRGHLNRIATAVDALVADMISSGLGQPPAGAL